MAILRPRRGKAADAANIVLERGEVFFEYPSTGPGTGYGKIKMGDGTTKYSSLPDFIPHPDDIKIGFTNSDIPTSISNNSTYLNKIIPGNGLFDIFTNLKQLLVNFNDQCNNTMTENANNICNSNFILDMNSTEFVIPTSRNNLYIQSGAMWLE